MLRVSVPSGLRSLTTSREPLAAPSSLGPGAPVHGESVGLDAITYLEEERPGTGRALRDAVEELVELLMRFSRAFPLLPEAPGEEVRAVRSSHAGATA